MAPRNSNLTAAARASRTLANHENEKAILAEKLRAEPLKEVTLAPLYQPYFGKVMTVGLNGINVYVPVNGRSYKIPESFAKIVQGRRRAVDDYIQRQTRMADVQNNYERNPGELVF